MRKEMTHPYDVLELNSGAKFIFTPCPGTKNSDLVASIKTLKSAGATAIISLLPDSEIDALSVPNLGQEISDQGMTWYQLPVVDDCAPEQLFFDAFNHVKDDLLNRYKAGETLAIHCRGGSGRTGLMAAILLLESGESWGNIKPQIQALRPKALTLTPHINFLKQQYSLGDSYDN